MLDKELCARFSPLTGCWATNVIVNGLGPMAQKFWLNNNLIAQIPGSGGAAGKAYSIEWALEGHGILLHPEGTVGWHRDTIAELFAGAVDMAAEAAARSRSEAQGRNVYVVPVVWKLQFLRDVEARLAAEMAYVEQKLALPAPHRATHLGERVYRAYAGLLARDEASWGLASTPSTSFGERQGHLLERLAGKLENFVASAGATPPRRDTTRPDPSEAWSDLIRAGERPCAPRAADDASAAEARRIVRDMRRVLRFRPMLYPAADLAQEHVAEMHQAPALRLLRGLPARHPQPLRAAPGRAPHRPHPRARADLDQRAPGRPRKLECRGDRSAGRRGPRPHAGRPQLD